jgi:serine/threonine protein phosphatase PrpC
LVTEEEIRLGVISGDHYSACERLVALAKERGGPDNITVGLLRVVPKGEKVAKEVRDTRELEEVKW